MENITDDSFIPVDLLPLFEFSSYDRVLLPFEPGSIVITSNIREAYIDDNGVKQDYTITENIKFVDIEQMEQKIQRSLKSLDLYW